MAKCFFFRQSISSGNSASSGGNNGNEDGNNKGNNSVKTELEALVDLKEDEEENARIVNEERKDSNTQFSDIDIDSKDGFPDILSASFRPGLMLASDSGAYRETRQDLFPTSNQNPPPTGGSSGTTGTNNPPGITPTFPGTPSPSSNNENKMGPPNVEIQIKNNLQQIQSRTPSQQQSTSSNSDPWNPYAETPSLSEALLETDIFLRNIGISDGSPSTQTTTASLSPQGATSSITTGQAQQSASFFMPLQNQAPVSSNSTTFALTTSESESTVHTPVSLTPLLGNSPPKNQSKFFTSSNSFDFSPIFVATTLSQSQISNNGSSSFSNNGSSSTCVTSSAYNPSATTVPSSENNTPRNELGPSVNDPNSSASSFTNSPKTSVGSLHSHKSGSHNNSSNQNPTKQNYSPSLILKTDDGYFGGSEASTNGGSGSNSLTEISSLCSQSGSSQANNSANYSSNNPSSRERYNKQQQIKQFEKQRPLGPIRALSTGLDPIPENDVMNETPAFFQPLVPPPLMPKPVTTSYNISFPTTLQQRERFDPFWRNPVPISNGGQQQQQQNVMQQQQQQLQNQQHHQQQHQQQQHCQQSPQLPHQNQKWPNGGGHFSSRASNDSGFASQFGGGFGPTSPGGGSQSSLQSPFHGALNTTAESIDFHPLNVIEECTAPATTPVPPPLLTTVPTSSSSSQLQQHQGGGARERTSKKRSRHATPVQSEAEEKMNDVSCRIRRKNSAVITAENKRRDSIKTGLEELQRMLPHIGRPEEEKISQANVLVEGGKYIKNLTEDHNRIGSDIEAVKKEIDDLNNQIEAFQSLLPADGAPLLPKVMAMRSLADLFHDHVVQRTVQNWRYWVFVSIMGHFVHSFDDQVSSANLNQLEETSKAWIRETMTLGQLRKDAYRKLAKLCAKTSIVDHPSRLPEEALSFVSREGPSIREVEKKSTATPRPRPSNTNSGLSDHHTHQIKLSPSTSSKLSPDHHNMI